MEKLDAIVFVKVLEQGFQMLQNSSVPLIWDHVDEWDGEPPLLSSPKPCAFPTTEATIRVSIPCLPHDGCAVGGALCGRAALARLRSSVQCFRVRDR